MTFDHFNVSFLFPIIVYETKSECDLKGSGFKFGSTRTATQQVSFQK